ESYTGLAFRRVLFRSNAAVADTPGGSTIPGRRRRCSRCALKYAASSRRRKYSRTEWPPRENGTASAVPHWPAGTMATFRLIRSTPVQATEDVLDAAFATLP